MKEKSIYDAYKSKGSRLKFGNYRGIKFIDIRILFAQEGIKRLETFKYLGLIVG